MATHGDYDPAKGGFYSAVSKGWHRDPTKIGETIDARREPTEFERQEFANSKWANNGKARFTPVPELERLIQLRDSDRADDRAKYDKLAQGTRRIQVNDYEAAKAQSTDGAA